MTEPTHNFRLWLFRKEAAFRLTDSALVWVEDGVGRKVDFADIRQIRVYESPGVENVPRTGRCVVTPHEGRAVVLQSNHFVGVGEFEDRSASYAPFVAELIRRVAAANPRVVFIRGMPTALWVTWHVLLALVLVVTPLAFAAMIYAQAHDRELSPNFFIQLAVCAGVFFAFFPILRLIRRNRPQVFDPLNWPPDLGRTGAD